MILIFLGNKVVSCPFDTPRLDKGQRALTLSEVASRRAHSDRATAWPANGQELVGTLNTHKATVIH